MKSTHFTPILLLLFFLFTTTTLFAQSQHYSRIKVNLETKTIDQLGALGLDAEHGDYQPGLYFISDFSKSEMELISDAGFTYEVIIEDVRAHYVSQNDEPVPTAGQRTIGDCTGVGFFDYYVPENFELGSMAGFLTYEEMLDNLDAMYDQYSGLITARTPIGTTLTHEGRPIYWLKISDNADTDETDEPEIFYNALHHAREPNGLSQMIYYMWYLLERYETDPEVKYLVDHTEMYFVPMINPDGYIYNETTDPNGGGFWRKNKRDNNGDGVFSEGIDGVDLNRNYGFEWAFDNNGSSGDPGSAVYRGPSAFSEPETQNVRDFCNAHEFEIALNYHTYGNLLIYPWAYSDQLADPVFEILAQALNRENEFLAGTSTETVGYQVNGPSDDWMYGESVTKPPIFSFTPEVGYNIYGFWPPSGEIIRFCQSTVLQNLTTAHLTLNFGIVTEQNPAVLETIDGDFDFNIRRYGLKDGELTVSLDAASSNIAATSAPQTFNLDQGEEVNSSFTYTLAADVQVGEALYFVLSLDNGIYTSRDTIVKRYGNPIDIFTDAGTMDNWSNVGVASNWGVNLNNFYSAPSSIGDSPFGNYQAGSENIIQLNEPVSLLDAEIATLSFWATWQIERLRDYAQVQISKDEGQTWEPVCGKYTVAGTTSQDFEEPVYHDFENDWVFEEMDISEYIGEEILIRFVMKANNNFFTADGFNFDDLTISKFDEVLEVSVYDIEDFSFSQNHPNPAVGYTVIDLDQQTAGSLHVYNLLGKEVLIQNVTEGDREVVVRTEGWIPGLYSYRLLVNGEWTAARKMMVME